MKRSKVPTVSGIDWAVVFDQQGCYVHMLDREGRGREVEEKRGREGGGEGEDQPYLHVQYTTDQ